MIPLLPLAQFIVQQAITRRRSPSALIAPGLAHRITQPRRALKNGSHVAAWARSRPTPASCRSLAQFTGGFGAGTPGRSLGTQTRSADEEIVQVTGVDIDTASPSMPTGIWAASALI